MATTSPPRAADRDPRATLPPLCRSRNVIRKQHATGAPVERDGLTEDEREPADAAGGTAPHALGAPARRSSSPGALLDRALAELVPDARRRRAALPLCPDCGSAFDVPRPSPSGPPGRWCRICLRWHPEHGEPHHRRAAREVRA